MSSYINKMTLILIVEDDRAFAEAIGEYLVRNGFEVKVVNSSLDALEYLQSKEPIDQPSLIFADLQLPDVDGGALASTLDSLGFHIPVIFMSSYSPWDLSKMNIIPPHTYVLHKPFTFEHLLFSIQQRLEDTA